MFRRRQPRLKVVAVEKGLDGYRSAHDRAAVLAERLQTVASGTLVEWGINDLRFLLADLFAEHAELAQSLHEVAAERDAARSDAELPENRFRLEYDWLTGRLYADDRRADHFRPLVPSGLLDLVGFVLGHVRADMIREAEAAAERTQANLASFRPAVDGQE